MMVCYDGFSRSRAATQPAWRKSSPSGLGLQSAPAAARACGVMFSL
jgi:hypothetical protein